MSAAYFLANVDVHDPDAYPDYIAAVSPTAARHGGHYLARGGAARTVEGTWTPHRVVLIGFDDTSALDGWLADPEAQAAFAIRHRIATSQVVTVEGLEGVTAQGGDYVLANITVHDPEAFEAYRDQVPAVLAQYGGCYLVRGGEHRVIEGDWQPARLVLIEYPDMDAAESFYASPEYAPLLAMRESATTSDVAFIAGIE